MQSYRFNEYVSSPDAPRWADVLARAHGAGIRPECMCRSKDAALMYIAAVRGAHVLKRMPFSGSRHASHCDHYEPPPELSGLGQVSGSAIRQDPASDTTALALDFALTKGASRAIAAGAPVEHDSVRADGTKLTLRATLHYLYDEAGLTRWTPKMRGKRGWGVVRRELVSAAANKSTKGKPLNDVLYIPEPYFPEHAAEIRSRRHAKLARLTDSTSARMLLIAPLKQIEQARFGHKMVLRHMPDMPLRMSDELHKRVCARFTSELSLFGHLEETHLLVIGTFSMPVPGVPELESACLVNVNHGWLPFESAQEHQLLEALADRRFTKGLRYNLASTKPLACAVLHDTAEPTALYLIPAEDADEYNAAAQALAEASGLASWWWHGQQPEPPDLPAPASQSDRSGWQQATQEDEGHRRRDDATNDRAYDDQS